jgi:hypothetical protein
MASTSYTSLISLASSYMDGAKATEVLQRQMEKCSLDPNTLSAADIRGAAGRFGTALGLYVSDASKRSELIEKLKTL